MNSPIIDVMSEFYAWAQLAITLDVYHAQVQLKHAQTHLLEKAWALYTVQDGIYIPSPRSVK